MCSESQRADALNAVTLIENIARLATQGMFGFIFASLAEAGKAYATFYVNAVRNTSLSYSSTSRLTTVNPGCRCSRHACPPVLQLPARWKCGD